jgi:hypothetical protein
MKLIYNGFDFSTIGELAITQAREMEGAPDQPQRARVTLRVRVDVFEQTYDQNRAALEQCRPALALPNAVLQWTNDAAGVDYVNQTAALVSDDLPEDWGQYHQTLNLVFSYWEQTPGGAANNVPLTFVKTGGEKVSFDVVNKWSHGASVERFSPFRSQRRQTVATIRVEGQWFGDTTDTLDNRRAALAAQAQAFNAAMNGSDGTLTFGENGAVFQGVVRIADWVCDVDQAVNAIGFSFTASYTLFPDETSYATAEFTAAERDDFNGQLVLDIQGRIQAPTEAAARVKLDAVLAAQLAARAYTGGQRLGLETTPSLVDGDDGATFIELSFNASYRKWKTTNQTATLGGVALGNVNAWRDEVTTERFDPLRSQRLRTTGGLAASGTLTADMGMAVADRRKALLVMQRQLKAQAATAEVALAYGDFSQTVRVGNFTAEINQAETGIDWSLTATYTLFPAEASYATAEFTAAERDDFTGMLTLEISGRVQAQSEAAARTALAALLGQQQTDRDYLQGQPLLFDTSPNQIQADADGVTFTELSFNASYRKWKTTNQAATFKGASKRAVPFGNVNRWRDHLTIARFDPLRPHRDKTIETIEAAGTFTADQSLSVTDRRAALLALQRAMTTEVNIGEGTLVYGDFSRVVRVAEFTAEINQAETGIDWSLTASYTVFPNETSYATAEWTAAEKDDFSGQLTLELSGRIQAPNEPAARAKLAAVLAQQVAERAYGQGQQLALDATPNRIDANADGVTFTELAFSAAYRKWKTTNLVATVQNAAGQAVPLGNVNRWRDSLGVSRYNPLRSLRERVTETIEAAGTLAGDMAVAVADRRAALLARVSKLKAAVNVPAVTLAYGDFSQSVRVAEFTAEINQAETGIDWSLTATYTLFPTESNYALADFTVEERDDFSGQLTLTVAGKIQSDSETNARTKLAAVLAAALAQRSYGKTAQALQCDASAAQLDGPDGATFTELSFTAGYRKWKTTNQLATYQPTGAAVAVPFGNVRTWRDHYAAQRFNELRSERRHATGSVEAAGTWTADPALSVTDRRTALLAQQRAMKAAVNSADGTLVYGDWSQVVRIEDFQAEVNQAETGIDWSCSASYSLFPNEGGYATADFTVDTRDEVETGDEVMTLAGRIEAPNGALARAKLDTLRTAVLKLYGWTLAQRLRNDATLSAIDANGDRTAGVPEGLETAGDFSALSLSFNEEYRRRMTGTLVSATLTRVDREDVGSQMLLTTFSGTVTATGPNAGAAYATALARAQALGANREPSIDTSTVFKGSTIAQEQRQTQATNAVEFVRLSFTYEYQSKLAAGRAFIELTTTVAQDTFGVDTETCAGSVLARDLATAQSIYAAQVRSLYASRLIQSEQTGGTVQKTQTGSGYAGQHIRFEFNLNVFSPKAAGSVGIKYSFEVNRDLLTLEQRSIVAGSCYAVNRPAADAALDGLFQMLNLGLSVRSRRVEDHERVVAGSPVDVLLKVDFEEEFMGRVTGSSGVLEMSLTEKVQYSGVRYAVQRLPFTGGQIGNGGVSLPQPAGVEAGSRTVSGTVTAATLATAQAWAVKQRALLTGDKLGNKYPQPEQWETGYEFVPRIDGIAKGTGQNVRLFRLSFTYAEILPWYPPT